MRRRGTGQSVDARSGGSLVLVVALAIALLTVASSYLFLPGRLASLAVLACLGVLSTIGVVALFGAAAGVFGMRRSPQLSLDEGGQSQVFLENMAEGVLIAAPDGSLVWANAAFRKLSSGLGDGELHSIERLFSGNPDASEI